MQINAWNDQGVEQRIRPVSSRQDTAVLRSAIDAARAGGQAGTDVLWRQQRAHPFIRNMARFVLGVGSVVVVGLLMALAVAGAGGGLIAVLIAFVVLGGSFVAVVWRTDVGIEIYGDGRLIRTGWGGIDEYNLRSYRRVTVIDRAAPERNDVDSD